MNATAGGFDSSGVRRILLQQMAAALGALDQKRLSDEAVHTARKQLRRARASLRLLRCALKDATYRRENVTLRNIARRLSEIRDSKVLLDTFEKLVTRSGTRVRTGMVRSGAFRAVLQSNYVVARRRVMKPLMLKSVRAGLRRLLTRGERWHLTAGRPPVRGLKRTYADGRRGLARARRHPSAAGLHEWRKQAKYLWYQLELAGSLCSCPMKDLADRTHRLADCLGDDHDLVVLRDQVARHPGTFSDLESQRLLVTLIDRRRAKLLGSALRLGQHVYQERPREFGSRFGNS